MGSTSASRSRSASLTTRGVGFLPYMKDSTAYSRRTVGAMLPSANRSSRTVPSRRSQRSPAATVFEMAEAERVPTFPKKLAGRLWGEIELDGLDELPGAQMRLLHASEDLHERELPAARGRAETNGCLVNRERREGIAGRGSIGDVAAERPAALDLPPSDGGAGVDEKRELLFHERLVLQSPMCREGTDAKHRARMTDALPRRDGAQIENEPSVLAPPVPRDHEIGSAGERHRVGMTPIKLEGIIHGARPQDLHASSVASHFFLVRWFDACTVATTDSTMCW